MSDSPGPQLVSAVADEVSIDRESLSSKVVLTADHARVVVFAFAAGQELREHRAPVPILVQVLSGEVVFSVAGTNHDLEPGMLLHVPAGMPHSVSAPADSKMLLTLLTAK